MNQEIKVTKCSECPMHDVYNDYGDIYHSCSKNVFEGVWTFDDVKLVESIIHPNCPIKGETITFKIGENE